MTIAYYFARHVCSGDCACIRTRSKQECTQLVFLLGNRYYSRSRGVHIAPDCQSTPHCQPDLCATAHFNVCNVGMVCTFATRARVHAKGQMKSSLFARAFADAVQSNVRATAGGNNKNCKSLSSDCIPLVARWRLCAANTQAHTNIKPARRHRAKTISRAHVRGIFRV